METHPVDIWTFPLTRDCPTHLSEDEVARANRFRFEEDRVRWTRARSSLRMILSRYAGDDPGSLCFGYGKHGKPHLLPVTQVEFNLSHAGDWAIVAVTRMVPVGVDIERIRKDVDMAPLLRRLGETDLPPSTNELSQAESLPAMDPPRSEDESGRRRSLPQAFGEHICHRHYRARGICRVVRTHRM